MNVEKLVTHRINLEEVPAYFEKVYKRDIFFGKIMINIDNQIRVLNNNPYKKG